MYKVTKKTDNETVTEFKCSCKEILMEGLVMGTYFAVMGVVLLIATPFVAIYALYAKWRDGGVYCESGVVEDRDRELFE